LDNEGGKGIIIRSKNKPGNKQTKVIALNHVNHNNRKKKKASEHTTMKQRGKTKTTLLSQPLKKNLLNLL
jgi:co-chaperonin GroES (HSP10)